MLRRSLRPLVGGLSSRNDVGGPLHKRVMQVANDLVTWERILEKTKEEWRLVEAQKRQLETEVRKLTREHRQTSLFGAAA